MTNIQSYAVGMSTAKGTCASPELLKSTPAPNYTPIAQRMTSTHFVMAQNGF